MAGAAGSVRVESPLATGAMVEQVGLRLAEKIAEDLHKKSPLEVEIYRRITDAKSIVEKYEKIYAQTKAHATYARCVRFNNQLAQLKNFYEHDLLSGAYLGWQIQTLDISEQSIRYALRAHAPSGLSIEDVQRDRNVLKNFLLVLIEDTLQLARANKYLDDLAGKLKSKVKQKDIVDGLEKRKTAIEKFDVKEEIEFKEDEESPEDV